MNKRKRQVVISPSTGVNAVSLARSLGHLQPTLSILRYSPPDGYNTLRLWLGDENTGHIGPICGPGLFCGLAFLYELVPICGRLDSVCGLFGDPDLG